MSVPQVSAEFAVRYGLRPDASCLIIPTGQAILLPDKHRLTDLDAAQLAMLRALAAGPTELAAHPGDSVTELVHRLTSDGWLTATTHHHGVAAYTVRPFRHPTQRAARPPATAVLSKFAVLHRVGAQLVVEHPLAWCDVQFHSPTALAAFADCTSGSPVTPGTLAAALRDDLWAGGFLVLDAATEDNQFARRSWSPHELWFHRRSSYGDRVRSWAEFGPTRWAAPQFPPLPARKPEVAEQAIALAAVDLDTLRSNDTNLVAAMEDRVSHRDFTDADPIGVTQLGELLYRCARTRSVRTQGGEEFPSRPYPSGGSLYELEIYPVVRQVAGLAAGMYHYDSFDHVLRPLADTDSAAIDRLLQPAALTLTNGQLPQVLLILAARTGRIMWTYEQIPYAVMLKHVGVLTQNIYLVATAMGLGAVAQGYVDTTAFAAATGSDELDECALGSVVLGAPQV